MNTNEGYHRDRTVLIIGGGIGGLAAAIGLQKVGLEVEVYEQTEELREVGAGLSMWRNGLEALEFLGGYEEVVRAGEKITWGETRTPDGSVLTKIHTPSTIPTGTDMPEMIALHRADLQRILHNRVGEGAVNLNHKCVGVSENGGQVTAQFASGKEVSGDLLVGADGINSVTRSSLHGAVEPRFTGVRIWRGVTRIDHPMATSDTSFQALGKGRRFFAVGIGDGRTYWGATKRVQRGEDRPTEDSKRRLASEFDEWFEPIPALIEATPQEAVIEDEVADREPFDEWGRGRITLLGDAAHVAAPYLGQGASQALEDAVWLTRYLDNQPDTTAALRAYEAHRQDRTAMIVRSARKVERMYHLSNSLTVAVRNLLLKYGPNRLMEGALKRNTTADLSTL